MKCTRMPASTCRLSEHTMSAREGNRRITGCPCARPMHTSFVGTSTREEHGRVDFGNIWFGSVAGIFAIFVWVVGEISGIFARVLGGISGIFAEGIFVWVVEGIFD